MSGPASVHTVLRPFRCSFDGVKVENLTPGDRRDFGAMAAGLERAGLIGSAAVAEPPPPPAAGHVLLDEIHEERRPADSVEPADTMVEIPENWRDLSWPELSALSAKLSAGPVTKKKHAVAAIEAELALRAAAPTHSAGR